MSLVQKAHSSGKVEAAVYFPGLRSSDSVVGLELAWSEAAQLKVAVGKLRERVIALQAECCCIVVPRSVIEFPAVWSGKPKVPK